MVATLPGRCVQGAHATSGLQLQGLQPLPDDGWSTWGNARWNNDATEAIVVSRNIWRMDVVHGTFSLLPKVHGEIVDAGFDASGAVLVFSIVVDSPDCDANPLCRPRFFKAQAWELNADGRWRLVESGASGEAATDGGVRNLKAWPRLRRHRQWPEGKPKEPVNELGQRVDVACRQRNGPFGASQSRALATDPPSFVCEGSSDRESYKGSCVTDLVFVQGQALVFAPLLGKRDGCRFAEVNGPFVLIETSRRTTPQVYDSRTGALAWSSGKDHDVTFWADP